MKKITNVYYSFFLLLGLLLSACSDDSDPTPTVGTVAGSFAPANSLTAVTFTNAQGTATTGVLNPVGTFTVSLPAGSYTLSFTAAAGYAAPAPQTVTVTAGQTNTLATITVATASPSSLLTAKNWRNTDIRVSEISIYDFLVDACQKDDLVKFNADKTATYNNGLVKCDPNEPATQNGSWDLLNNTQLSITDPDGTIISGTIKTLTATTLIVTTSQDITGSGSPVPVEITFTAQ